MDSRDLLDIELTAAFRMLPGRKKEREINRLTVELIALIVRSAMPDASEIWFDWDQDGLCVTSIRDSRGILAAPDDVDVDLAVYASNIRDSRCAPQLTAIRSIHGPFVLHV